MILPAPKRSPLLFLLPAFALLLVGALWTAALMRISQEREDARKQGVAESEAFVRILEEHAVRLLRQVDQASLFLRYEFELKDGKPDLSDFARRKGLLPDDVSVLISFADAGGKVIAANRPYEPLNIAGREYFKVHVAQDSGNLYIGRPIIGTVTKKWAVPMSRRLNHADGSFAGVVVISVDPLSLASDYNSPRFGRQGTVSLLGTDGVLRIRRIGGNTSYGETVDLADWRRRMAGEPSASFDVPSPFDQVKRIYSYRRLADFPLIAIAGIAENEAYADFNRSRDATLLSAVLGTLIIAAFIAVLMLQGTRLQKSQRLATQAQAIYKAAAEGSLDAFYIFSVVRGGKGGAIEDFTFTEVNERGARLIGMPKEKILGRKLGELLPVTRAQGLLAKYAKVAETGEPLDEEFEFVTSQNNVRWLWQQVVAIGGGIALSARDITERRKIELEVSNNRKFLQTLIDYLPVLVFAKSVQPQNYGRFVVWNTAAEVITGYSAGEVMGKTDAEIFPPELAAIYEAGDQRLLADPMVVDNPEHEFRRKDGQPRLLHTTAVPIFDAADRPEYILGVAEDITTRKRQEFELRAREAELQAVNDALPLGMFRMGMNGDLTYANRTYERIAGITEAAARGHGWVNAIHPDDRAQVLAAGAKIARTRDALNLTHRFLHADGRILWGTVKVAPIWVDGQINGFVGSIDDITERRETQQARRMLAAILEASVDFVATCLPGGMVTYLNPAARRMSGLAADADVTRTSVADYYTPEVFRHLQQQAVPAALKDGLWIGESTVLDRDKREIPVNHMIIAHKGADGAIEYFSSVMHDISAARDAQQALRDSESRMRTITDALPAMIAFVDAGERYRFVNRAYEESFGKNRDAILGSTVHELFGDEGYAAIKDRVRRALAGYTVVFEREESPQGQYRCLEITYIPQARPGSTAVIGFHVMAQDITARKVEEKRLIRLAHLDSLTGLANRAGFLLTLADLMARSRMEKSLLALMYLDIDHFKNVNDTHGHATGDALLKACAGRMTRSLRDSDVVARLGGDEFTIILPNLRKPEDATAVAGKIVAAMRPAFSLEQQSVNITTSIGLAFYQGGEMSAEALIQRADEMLYQSKAAGRNTFNVAPLLRVQGS
jgi:diguanylate cyclase (GGDEF)-like protein/PAS domain S-box-containing protein